MVQLNVSTCLGALERAFRFNFFLLRGPRTLTSNGTSSDKGEGKDMRGSPQLFQTTVL